MKLLIISAILFVLIDSIYLYNTSNHFNKLIKKIQNTNITLDLYALILCYVFLVFGLYYFIIKDNRSIFDAFLLGIVIYGVYETTNKAIFKSWDWFSVFIDTLWGGILFATTTYLTYKINKMQFYIV